MVVRRRANTNSSVRRTPTISQWDTSSRPPISNDIYHPVALILSQTSFHRMIRDLCEIFLQLIVNYLIRFFEDRVILRNLQDRSDMEDRIIGVLKRSIFVPEEVLSPPLLLPLFHRLIIPLARISPL